MIVAVTCATCGQIFRVAARLNRKYCSSDCRNAGYKSKKSLGTYDGKSVYESARGYAMIVLGRSDEMPLHVYICEKLTGVNLRGTKHRVHHVDGNRLNNSLSNLVICENDATHAELHANARLKERGGNWKTDKYCPKCNTVKLKTDFPKAPNMKDGLHGYCKECSRTYVKRFIKK